MSYKCAYCDKSVNTKAILMMHIKNAHLEHANSQSNPPAPAPAPAPVPSQNTFRDNRQQEEEDDEDNPFPGGPTGRGAGRGRGGGVSQSQRSNEVERQPQKSDPIRLQSSNEDENMNRNMQNTRVTEPANSEARPVPIFQRAQVRTKPSDTSGDIKSIEDFKELRLTNELMKGIQAKGFDKPSDIQKVTLPIALLSGKDGRAVNLIAQAKSGTGKTTAFALILLGKVNPNVQGAQGICVVNTRELAVQVADEILKIGQYTGYKVYANVPGCPPYGGEPIVVGTPKTLQNSISRRQIDVSNLSVFVLDEADEMITNKGISEDANRILRAIPTTVQRLLFSATFPEHVKSEAQKIAPNAYEVFVTEGELTVEGIGQYFVRCRDVNSKIQTLHAIFGLGNVGSAIVFCNTIDMAERLATSLVQEGYSVGVNHGKLLPEQRDEIMTQFRENKVKVLISTNVVSRGLDILQIGIVVNFDLPVHYETRSADSETYLHRIGRTGRFGRKGAAVNFVANEYDFNCLQTLKRYFNIEISELPSDVEQLEKALEQITNANQK